MSLVVVTLQFSEQLDCGECDDVFLWLFDPLKLAVNEGVTDPALYKYLVQAKIKSVICQSASSWSYEIEYDDAVLLDPEDPLQECDIKRVCCVGCTLQFVHDNQVITVTDTITVNLTLTGNDLAADVNVSADAMNAVEIRADGLYVPQGSALGFNVLDTATVDLTLSAGPTLEADVKISADANNCLEEHADGLYMQCPCVVDSQSIDFDIDLSGCITGEVLISADSGNFLSLHADGLFSDSNITNVVDSTSINLSITSGPVQVLGAVVLISATAGNLITINPDGLYATPVVSDTPSVNLTVTAGSISADVILSAMVGNALQILGDGLFYTPTVLDSATIDFNVSLLAVTGSVKISATAGNLIVANADGIYATPVVTDTSTVDLTVAAGTISAAVKISATAGNLIVANADGIYATPVVLDSSTIDLSVAAGVISAALKISADSFNLAEAHADGLWVPALDGWIPFNATLTFVSANSFSLVGDWTDRLTFGDRIKLTDGGIEYYAVTNAVFSLGITTVSITAGTDFTLSGGAITNGFFSHAASPVGYPTTFNYTPTYASVVGTWTIVTTNLARFNIIGRSCFVRIEAVGTSGGNPSALTATLPLTSVNTFGPFACFVENGVGVTLGGIGRFNSTTVVQGQRYDIANFSNGAGRMLSIAGEYRFA